MTKRQLVSKVDLKFEANWDPLRKFIKNVRLPEQIIDLPEPQTNNQRLYYTTWQADVSDYWLMFGGPLIDKMIPGMNKFKKLVEPLNYDGVSFSIMTTRIDEHIDKALCLSYYDSHEIIPDRQCKINYIITTEDPDALTTVIDRDDPENIQRYDSTLDMAWLIDINHKHSLECKGYREILTFRFCETFDTVKNFFDEKGPLIFR